jgi:hypothetical protein
MIGYALIRRTCLRAYLAAVGLLLAPFSLYLYLWWRALQHPPVTWTDTTTLDQLLYHVLAKQYFQFAFANSFEQMLAEAEKLVPQLLASSVGLSLVLVVIGLPLIVWGWATWLRKERLVAAAAAIGCLLVAFWVLRWGETSDLKHFLQPLAPVLAVCFALGLARAGSSLPQPRQGRYVIALLGALLCATLLRANWDRLNLSDDWGPRDRWTAVLSQMAPNAIFLSDFDQPSFFTMYLQNVEGLRRDVTLVRSVRLPAPGQPQAWYLNTIEDPALRQALRDLWPQALSQALDIHDQTAVLAYLLARRFTDRPIYAVHGPMHIQIPGPPYFVGLSEDLVRLQLAPPDMLRSQAGPAQAVFPAGISLVAFHLNRAAAGTGEMVGFTAAWRLATPLPRAQFAVALVPPGMDLEQFTGRDWQDERLLQAFPVAYGQWGLAPSPAGTARQQQGEIIIPSNASSGAYRIAIAIAPLYVSQYPGWVEIGEVQVSARPLPRNGP